MTRTDVAFVLKGLAASSLRLVESEATVERSGSPVRGTELARTWRIRAGLPRVNTETRARYEALAQFFTTHATEDFVVIAIVGGHGGGALYASVSGEHNAALFSSGEQSRA